MFPKTAESSGRCRCSVVRRASADPGFPRRTRHRWLIICRNNSKNSKGCLGHYTARCLSASFEMICALVSPRQRLTHAQPVSRVPAKPAQRALLKKAGEGAEYSLPSEARCLPIEQVCDFAHGPFTARSAMVRAVSLPISETNSGRAHPDSARRRRRSSRAARRAGSAPTSTCRRFPDRALSVPCRTTARCLDCSRVLF